MLHGRAGAHPRSQQLVLVLLVRLLLLQVQRQLAVALQGALVQLEGRGQFAPGAELRAVEGLIVLVAAYVGVAVGGRPPPVAAARPADRSMLAQR